MRKILALALVCTVVIWMTILSGEDANLHVVFCDVGQGDAILVYRGTTQMLIDGGPSNQVLECLAQHMPFFDRKLDVVVLTHPQADHMTGLLEVFDRYEIDRLISGSEESGSQVYREFLEKVQAEGMAVTNAYLGDEVTFDGVKFRVVWPTLEWSLARMPSLGVTDQVLGLSTDGEDLNSFSVSGILEYGEFSMFTSGDADVQVEDQLVDTGGLVSVDVMKVPHHGSKTGMSEKLIGILKPALAVVSVGSRNRYGHPGESILNMLDEWGVITKRTDLDGQVEIVSDGRVWWLR